MPKFSGYLTSKSAAATVTQCFAVENPDIFVTQFHPGAILDSEMGASGQEQGINLAADHIDLPGHYAVWLASAEADFLKNKNTWANWDISELKASAEEISTDSSWSNVGVHGFPWRPFER
jgi:hypothetical protein